MTAAALRFDLYQTRVRTRWTMSVSSVAHALLFLWLVFHPIKAPDMTPITEITLLEPGDLAPAPAGSAPPSASGQPTSGVAARSLADVHFQRQAKRGDIAPDPQASWAFEDRLDARLAAMQQDASHMATGIAPTNVPTSLFGSSPSVIAGGAAAPARARRWVRCGFGPRDGAGEARRRRVSRPGPYFRHQRAPHGRGSLDHRAHRRSADRLVLGSGLSGMGEA